MLEKLRNLKLKLGDLFFQSNKDSQIRIKDHFAMFLGKTPSTKNSEYYENGNLPWINSGALNDLENIPYNRLITQRAQKEYNLEFSKVNSVLVSLIGLNIVWCKKKVLFNQSIVNLTSDNQLENATLFFALRQTNLKCLANGCVFKALNKRTFNDMKINWVSNPKKQKVFLRILSKNSLN